MISRRRLKFLIKRFFCLHQIKDRVSFSKRRNKHVYECLRCGKILFSKR